MSVDVSDIVARIDSECPSIAQVIKAQTGGSQQPIASQASLYSLLNARVGGRMYPVQAPELVTHPSAVYQLVASAPGVFEGFDVSYTDLFVLQVRGPDYDALITIVNNMISDLSGETIEVTDMSHDYDQEENLYRIGVEISYSYLTAAAQTKPAAYVYPVTRTGEASVYDNYTKQLINGEYAILVITDNGDIPDLLNEIQAALLGWQRGVEYHEMEYSSGASIEGVGGMEMWRETYRDAYYLTQSGS